PRQGLERRAGRCRRRGEGRLGERLEAARRRGPDSGGPAPVTRRRPVLKILGGFAGVLALLLGGFWLWLSSVGDRRWEELRADVVRRKEAAAQRELTRDPLRGDPLPGCVWTDYMAADALIRATPGAENLLLNLQQKSMGLDLVQARS